MHKPATSACPEKISDSISAISRRQRSIHAAIPARSVFHLLERPAVRFERGLLPGRVLPALHDNVDVLRIELHAAADPLRQFGGRERRATAKERVVHQLAAPE